MDYLGGNTIKGSIAGIKVDLMAHKYPLVGDIIEIDSFRIASMDDIAAMKVNSVANDGTRVKDFIDLYFLITQYGYSIDRLLGAYKEKYSQRNALHGLKSLVYFEDVDVNDWPEMMKKKSISWDEIKIVLGNACEEYIRKIT